MAQLEVSFNQEEILQLLFMDRDAAFQKLLTIILNKILRAESEEQLKATPWERTAERTDSRNGFRDRGLVTRIGSITLRVPRHRNQPFRTLIFDNYSRSEAALVAAMAEMVVCGVSTRKIAKIMEKLCGTTYSKSAVSALCRELDKPVEDFRNRMLTGQYPFVTVDATYFKVRENHRVVSKAFMIACGTNEQGVREVIGFGVYPRETADTWTDFLKSLRKRGLTGALMFTSDAHEGILKAISRVYPDVPWQRCQFHFARNIIDKTPQKYQIGLRTELQEMFSSASLREAMKKRDEIIADYRDIAESAMICLEEGFESCMTARVFSDGIYRNYRTSNHLERLNRELKKRSRVIGVFMNETSLLRLMGSVLIEAHERIQTGRKMFSPAAYSALSVPELTAKLKQMAEEQRMLLAA